MVSTYPTIPQLLDRQLQQNADHIALWTKRLGHERPFQATTWQELVRDIDQVAAALLSLGIEPGDRVALVSPNRYEWIVIDLAILAIGAIHVPVHATLTPTQVTYQLRHATAKVAFFADASLAAGARDVHERLFHECRCVILDPIEESATVSSPTSPGDNEVLSWREFRSLADVADGGRVREQTVRSGDSAAIATILYTSGTTGEPKGVVLSHANVTSNALGCWEATRTVQGDRRLCMLPLSHIYARTCDYYTSLAASNELALASSRERVIAECQEFKPHLLNAVPFFYQRMCQSLLDAGQAEVDGSLASLLGGEIRECHSGGAPLPGEVFDFFTDQKVSILQGYGLTESSPVISLSRGHAFRRGAVGQPLPEVEVKIAEDGEILARGPNLMQGYYLEPAATEQTIQDGWLHTGDLGLLDQDGYLFIRGRKKEMIVTNAGKNIAPLVIESRICSHPMIAQALVVGDRRDFLVALVVPDQPQLLAELERQAIAFPANAERSDWLEDDRVHQVVAHAIGERLSQLSHHEQVRCFALLPSPFSQGNGELTAKLSMRREVIVEHYSETIDELYRVAQTFRESSRDDG